MILVYIYKNPKNLVFYYKKKYVCLYFDNKLPLLGILKSNKFNADTFIFNKNVNNQNILYYNLEDYFSMF
jgi:hypothetical protein